MMGKMKNSLIFLLLLVFCGVGGLAAFAAEHSELRVYDLADLFYEQEEQELAEIIGNLQSEMEMDVAVVTTEENARSTQEYADDFYEEMGLGFGEDHDGALFLIDMSNGELWISTEGNMVRYLTDERIGTILDHAVSYAYDGDFYRSAVSFLDDLETCYQNGIASDQYTYDLETGQVSRYRSIRWYEFLIALLVALAAAGAAVYAVLRDYGMKNQAERMSANFNLSYRKDSAFALGNVLADVLLGSYVTKMVIRSQNQNAGGSGGGLAGGGRSSVHRSGSGRSHGGGGRKFR